MPEISSTLCRTGGNDGGTYSMAAIGYRLLRDPYLNKGTAFSQAERDAFHLHGLIPPHVGSLREQAQRRMEALSLIEEPLQKYIFLRQLQDVNETLFYYICTHHIEEVLPLIYTPTVGEGCKQFSHIYWTNRRGLFLSYPHRGKIEQILANPDFDHIQVIVVTDGERILGLGDQGAGGMGIPIGKLSLYTACGGIHPATTLPILLDVGTDNLVRLRDPMYIGWRHHRIRGKQYEDFVEEFVQAVDKRWPQKILLQWEDFARDNAAHLLKKYKDRLCTFNDDIQGTAAIAAASIITAVSLAGYKFESLKIVIAGAGSAGCGIAELLKTVMKESGHLSEEEAADRFYILNSKGLIIKDQHNQVLDFQMPFAQKPEVVQGWKTADPYRITLSEVVENVRPHILLGVSANPKLFTEAMIRSMAEHTEHPIIMPLSNPTSCMEAQPADIIKWTDGRALVCCGSPQPPFEYKGVLYHFAQTNNVYVYPGIGLGVLAAQAQRVSDEMFLAAAKAVAALSPALRDKTQPILPPIATLCDVARRVALAVAKVARNQNLTPRPYTDSELEELIRLKIWTPEYLDLLSPVNSPTALDLHP